jgi:hypothetical protein
VSCIKCQMSGGLKKKSTLIPSKSSSSAGETPGV